MGRFDIRSVRTIFRDYFQIDEARVSYQLPNGEMSGVVRRLSFVRGDSCAAVVVNEVDGTTIMARQFRFPTVAKGPGWILEIVAGTVENGELPEDCIRREIKEELGYEALCLSHLRTFYTSPGGSSERVHLFHAVVSASSRTDSGGGAPEEQEDIEAVEISLAEVPRLLASGSVIDAKTIIGLSWLVSSPVGRNG